ncbi:MAG: DNA recombination protein RmuC [Pseudobacteriovorax sp.]|nr:DNA recombination protein RmuC [Pseudobacteriovorax sp.]
MNELYVGIMIGAASLGLPLLIIMVVLIVQKSKLKTTFTLTNNEKELQLELLRSKIKNHAEMEESLSHLFKSLAATSLSESQQTFLSLAKASFSQLEQASSQRLSQKEDAVSRLVQPISQALDQVKQQVGNIEKERIASFQVLKEQVGHLKDLNLNLLGETSKLATALKSSTVRGSWGEVQLKRIVELSGMLEHCDFSTQETVTDESSQIQRPDMIIRLPEDRFIAVDSKVPLDSYLKEVEADSDKDRDKLRQDHAAAVKRQIQQLSRKAYWKALKKTPEFVLLFMPGESFFSAALSADPTLIEEGIRHNVIIATPTTLLALLRTIAYSWRQDTLATNTELIAKLGAELYQRMADFSLHMEDLGKNLSSGVASYNSAVGSLERRLLVTSRKFADLGVATGKKQIAQIPPVEKETRVLRSDF